MKVTLQDKEVWYLEVSHEDFDNFLFAKQRMVSIEKEVDEEGIYETTSQVEEGGVPRIINTDEDT